MLRLGMIEERVLEHHQQREFDGEDDGDIPRQRRTAHPPGEPLTQARARAVIAIEG